MGALKLHTQRAGTIRRVVRVSGSFVCGLCRHAYEDLHEARGCLDRCWSNFQELDPVIVKKVSGHLVHRCRYCARDYEDRNIAESCAEQCKTKARRKSEAESRIAGSEDRIPKKEPLRLSARKAMIVPATPIRRKPALKAMKFDEEIVQKVVDDAVATITADANEKAVEPVPTAPEVAEPVAAEVGKKKKPSEIFYRDQAKYVCTVCHEKYFTKIEVSNCYEAHE